MTGATSPIHGMQPNIVKEGLAGQLASMSGQFSLTPKPKTLANAQTSISNEVIQNLVGQRDCDEEFDPAELKLLPVLASDRS